MCTKVKTIYNNVAIIPIIPKIILIYGAVNQKEIFKKKIIKP